MRRIRRLFTASPQTAYEPIEDSQDVDDVNDQTSLTDGQKERAPAFSWFEYSVFLLLGISMLWAWNMFLAAAPYFYRRFQSNEWTATHYQSSILSVSTVTNLGSGYVLAKLQKGASYPKRIAVSIIINMVVFTLLAFSTVLMKDVSVSTYFGFLMVMVFGASLATGVNQNGVFAYVSGFARQEYVQAIMAGQGIAGVLPCIVQIISVLAVRPPEDRDRAPGEGPGEGPGGPPQKSSKSAFAYFITATAISGLALASFLLLAKRRATAASKFAQDGEHDDITGDSTHRKTVSLWTLFKKLRWLAMSVFLCFAVTMVFPVFTADIVSVNDPHESRLYERPIFISTAFLFWNVGDLLGRLSVLIPQLSLVHRPGVLFGLAVARIGFIPLYMLCNVGGRGAVIRSDFFYLFIVQILFGVSNGYLGSSSMMGASEWVSVEEREAAGGFMSLMLVGGLAAGSLLSFLVSSG